MMGGGSVSSTPLNTSGVDFSNQTDAANFLAELLDDTELQVIGNAYARYFWYGVVVVIGIAGLFNHAQKLKLRSRYVAQAMDIRSQ